MLNRVCVIGRLSADPELKMTLGGVSVTVFSLAVQRDYAKAGEEKQTDWIDVVAWRSTAEFINKYFFKGMIMCVEGKLQTRLYKDKNGSKRKVVEVMAENVYFCEGKKQSSAPAAISETDFEEIEMDEELPF